ncbi:MAG: integrin alpha [Nostoc sp.]|uniref:integrin alpha n=1 Tax=Nostoc sp. TaxID=1180 RepID=UPI002FFCA3E4
MMANSVFNLSTLNGTNGFAINGINKYDTSGNSVSSAGDINGDSIDDLIIGAPDADPNAPSSGQSYVVFGSKDGFSAQFNLSTLNGTNGFAINGINPGDDSGHSVSSAGDINGDGIDDLIIGASTASPNGKYSGQSYVVFGSKDGFSPQFNLSTLNGTNGFAINGINPIDQLSSGSVSSAGDINGDGIDDLIIGAPPANNTLGQSYVVFGSKGGFDAQLNLSTLNGINGFVINGINRYDFSGTSVNNAGDINGDGIDDLIIGAPIAPSGEQLGQTYVVVLAMIPSLVVQVMILSLAVLVLIYSFTTPMLLLTALQLA